MTRFLTFPDAQVPYQDKKAIASIEAFIRYIKPDALLIVGDELDAPSPSKWSKGLSNEYAGTLQRELDECHDMLASLRAAVGKDKPIHLMRSNHGERILNYINRNAPALDSIKALAYESLLGLGELGITFHRQPYEFAPGWVMAHGDEGSMIQTPGGTALGLAKKWGKSVICGHTHKAGLQHHHLTLNGRVVQSLYGIETGHVMDYGNGKNKAGYLKAGSANWQQAVTLFDVDGKSVSPHLIMLRDSRVQWDGKVYG